MAKKTYTTDRLRTALKTAHYLADTKEQTVYLYEEEREEDITLIIKLAQAAESFDGFPIHLIDTIHPKEAQWP